MFKDLMAGAHRLSRVNYAPRAIAFAFSFIIITLLAQERGWENWHLTFPALYLLIYPHVLAVASGLLSATAKFELRAILADSLILGFLAAYVDFYLWLSFGFMVAVALNASVVGGSRQLVLSLSLYTLGVLCGGIINDWHIQVSGSFYLDILSMSLLLAYVLSVGFLAYNQNARLISTSREIEERNRVFRALVEISSSADLVGEVQEFIKDALNRIHDLYPKYGLGMVVRDAKRPKVLRFVEFVDVDKKEQKSVVKFLTTTNTPECREMTWVSPYNGAIFQMVFDNSRSRGNEGIIVVRAKSINSLLREAARLSLQMLGIHVENKMLARDLKHAAERDPLTGIFNRGRIDAELASVIRSRKQHDSMEFAVLMIDVIGLKSVNDKYGHEAGDAFIRETAAVLQQVCRATDVFGRYGGDEFVIICHGSSLSDAEGLRQRIKRDVSGSKLRLTTSAQETRTVQLELSIGLASSSETDPEKVLAAADTDMYRNKKAWYETHERYR